MRSRMSTVHILAVSGLHCKPQTTNGSCYPNPMGMKDIVRDNLKRLMERAGDRGEKGLATQNGLAKASKVGQRSIGRILSLEQEPGVDVLHSIAQAYDLQGWQLLIPNFDPANPPLLKEASDTERDFWKSFEEAQEKMRALERERARAIKAAAAKPVRRGVDRDSDKSSDPSVKKVAQPIKGGTR